MKAAPYTLSTLAELEQISFATAQDDMHKVVAGGQSLGAMLNLRLVRVNALHDLKVIADLSLITEDDRSLTIGSMVTHSQIEDQASCDVIRRILSHVAGGIAYRAVRNSGTIGGSLCHADPAADWVSAVPLLDGELTLEGPLGKRTLKAQAFVQFAFETALKPGEVLTSIRFPKYPETTQWSYRKHCRKTGEFALAIVGGLFDPQRESLRLTFGALGGAPVVFTPVVSAVSSDAGIDDLMDQLNAQTLVDQIDLQRDLLKQVCKDLKVRS